MNSTESAPLESTTGGLRSPVSKTSCDRHLLNSITEDYDAVHKPPLPWYSLKARVLGASDRDRPWHLSHLNRLHPVVL